MTRRRRLTTVGLLLALVAVGCQGLGRTGDDRLEGTVITFSIGVDEAELPAIRHLISTFQQHNRVQVKLQPLSRFRHPIGPQVNVVTDIRSQDLVERLRADASAGKPSIHLFAQDNVALSPLVQADLVHELRDLNLVPENAIRSLVPDELGKHFLPFRPNVRLGYANKKALDSAGEQPPRTEDDLVRVAGALRGSGTPKVTLSLAEGDPAAVTLCELIVSHGGDPRVLNDRGSVAAFSFVQRLFREGLLARDSFEARYDTEVDYLLSGKSALVQNWSFTSAQLAKADRLPEFEVYPGWSGPKEVHVIGGEVLGIPKGVKGKEFETAVALAKFLMGKEAQALLVRENSWPSFRSDIKRGEAASGHQSTFTAIQSALEKGWYRPAVHYWPTVTTELNAALTAVVLAGRPVQEVLDEAHERVRVAAERAGAPYP